MAMLMILLEEAMFIISMFLMIRTSLIILTCCRCIFFVRVSSNMICSFWFISFIPSESALFGAEMYSFSLFNEVAAADFFSAAGELLLPGSVVSEEDKSII